MESDNKQATCWEVSTLRLMQSRLRWTSQHGFNLPELEFDEKMKISHLSFPPFFPILLPLGRVIKSWSISVKSPQHQQLSSCQFPTGRALLDFLLIPTMFALFALFGLFCFSLRCYGYIQWFLHMLAHTRLNPGLTPISFAKAISTAHKADLSVLKSLSSIICYTERESFLNQKRISILIICLCVEKYSSYLKFVRKELYNHISLHFLKII